jgi:hypothetical protein
LEEPPAIEAQGAATPLLGRRAIGTIVVAGTLCWPRDLPSQAAPIKPVARSCSIELCDRAAPVGGRLPGDGSAL